MFMFVICLLSCFGLLKKSVDTAAVLLYALSTMNNAKVESLHRQLCNASHLYINVIDEFVSDGDFYDLTGNPNHVCISLKYGEIFAVDITENVLNNAVLDTNTVHLKIKENYEIGVKLFLLRRVDVDVEWTNN